MPISFYRVWCITEGIYVRKWANAVITDCPNDVGHTIDADKTVSEKTRPVTQLAVDPIMKPVEPGASDVTVSDRPAIEIQNGVTGFATTRTTWPLKLNTVAELCVVVKFRLDVLGTGTEVRIAMKYKSESVGEDSEEAFDQEGFVVVTVNQSNIGDVFEGIIFLPAGTAQLDDAVALQVGRDGNNEMGAGTNDDVDVPIQILSTKADAL